MAEQRKIVHVDMDAFYASVEQRDDPKLRGRPVVVAWQGSRSVVCAASYEARRFGIRSAMPALRAKRLCPQAVFVPPDFPRYRAVSRQVRAIFARHTALIEPLSLDEAYLDVSHNLMKLPSATAVAEHIRHSIRSELGLNASAGVAPNKFLAKIASDWRKPDGLYVIRPHEILRFLAPLPVRRIPGVGKVMEKRLQAFGVQTVGELRSYARAELEAAFGSMGAMLHRRAYGIDDGQVEPDRPVQSISAEDTLSQDLPLAELATLIGRLADKVWIARSRTSRVPRTVVLKLKTADFRILTRSVTPSQPPRSATELRALATGLMARVEQPAQTRYRLAGVGLSNFGDAPQGRQNDLFGESA